MMEELKDYADFGYLVDATQTTGMPSNILISDGTTPIVGFGDAWPRPITIPTLPFPEVPWIFDRNGNISEAAETMKICRDMMKLSKKHRRFKMNRFEISKVIFNKPATIVFWADGTKTIVKCGKNDIFDPEKGLAMCFAKKALGNKGRYYNTFTKFLPEDYKVEEPTEETPERDARDANEDFAK